MLARKSFLIVFVNLVGAALGLVAVKFIALTGTDPIGRVGYALALVGPFELIGDLGFNRAYLKRVSEGKNQAVALATFRRLKAVLILAMVAAVALALAVWMLVLGKTFEDTSTTVIAIALVYGILRAALAIPLLMFDARRETAKSQVSMLAEHLLRVPLVVVASLLIMAGAESRGPFVGVGAAAWAAAHAAELLALTYAVGAAATLAVAFTLLRHYPVGHPSMAFVRDMWRFGRPLILVSVAVALAYYVDRLAIGYFGNPTEVGYYFQSQRLTIVLQTIPLAVATLLLPTVSERHAALDRAAIMKVTILAERYMTLFVAPAIVFFAVIPAPIIDVILTSEYRPAAPTLAILSAHALVLGLFNLHMSLLAGLDRPRLQARAALIASVLNGFFVLLLVPDRGLHFIVPIRLAVGAALATLLAFSLALVYAIYETWRLTGKIPSHHVFVQLATAGVLAAGLTVVVDRWPPIGAIPLAFYGVVFFLVYVAALVAVRQLRWEEIRHFLDAVDPRHLGKYVHEELRSRPRR